MILRAPSSRLTPFSAAPEPLRLWPVAFVLVAGIAYCILAAVAIAADRSLSPLTWYLTRAAGVTLYLLLWFVTALGLGLTTTLLDRFGGRAALYSLHLFATELAYGFLALHLFTLAVDWHATFAPADLLIPFASDWREPWTGLGVIAGELTVLIGVSFGMRRWIGHRGWRALHLLAFPAYGLALAHALGSGSDAGAAWLRGIYLVTSLIVVWLTIYRVLRGPARARPDWGPVVAPSNAVEAGMIRR